MKADLRFSISSSIPKFSYACSHKPKVLSHPYRYTIYMTNPRHSKIAKKR